MLTERELILSTTTAAFELERFVFSIIPSSFCNSSPLVAGQTLSRVMHLILRPTLAAPAPVLRHARFIQNDIRRNELHKRALQLYRECLVIGRRRWPGSSPEAREEEMRYIVEETRALFRRNAAVSDDDEIIRCLEECEQRRDLALHYRNARPRLQNAINVTPQQLRLRGVQNTPAYMNSYYKK